MTSIPMLFAALPLAFVFGPGPQLRSTLGVVIVGSVIVATDMVLFPVPPLSLVPARHTKSPAVFARQLGRPERECG